MPKARCAIAMYDENLNQYIQSNPDPREIKRAVTVKMWLEGYTHRQIQNILGVSSDFISKWTDQLILFL